MAVVLTYYIIDFITDFNPFMHNFAVFKPQEF